MRINQEKTTTTTSSKNPTQIVDKPRQNDDQVIQNYEKLGHLKTDNISTTRDKLKKLKIKVNDEKRQNICRSQTLKLPNWRTPNNRQRTGRFTIKPQFLKNSQKIAKNSEKFQNIRKIPYRKVPTKFRPRFFRQPACTISAEVNRTRSVQIARARKSIVV